MPPVTVMLKPVSGLCNMRCRYCFYADEMKRRDTAIYPVMSNETLEATVRRTMAYADEYATFVFQGGEPTLAGISFYETLIMLQRKYNPRGLPISNAIQTNGLALTDELIAFFAQNHFLVGVSLDGINETHDLFRKDTGGQNTFERVHQTVERLDKAGVQYNILCVVNKAVAEKQESVLKELSRYPFVQFIPCMDDLDGTSNDYSLSNQAYADFLKLSFHLYESRYLAGDPISMRHLDNWLGILLGYPPENCAMTGRCALQFVIESNGDVYPCDFYALDEWCLGNVHTHSFRQLRRSPVAEAFCACSLEVPHACRECRWYPLCRNGCRRERNPETGLFRLCEGTRQFFDACGDRMQKLAQMVSHRNNHGF